MELSIQFNREMREIFSYGNIRPKYIEDKLINPIISSFQECNMKKNANEKYFHICNDLEAVTKLYSIDKLLLTAGYA